MKHKKNHLTFSGLLVMATMLVVSCQKTATVTDSLSATTTSSDLIAVAASLSANASSTNKSTASTDSVYVVHSCAKGYHRDSVSTSTLPAAIDTYLTTNYAGFTYQKAYSIVNSSSVIAGYVVIIQFNEKPVAIEFNASGAFVKVLEQRDSGDTGGKGYHAGGRFEHRDGRHRDTIALSSLPAAISSWFASNNSNDTLVAAFRDRDSSILVLSKNNSAFATVFTSAGVFVNRVQLQSKASKVSTIEQAALPATVLSYLTTTYPGYVFEKAFVIKPNTTVQGYVVVIDANSTKYGLLFDVTGKIVKTVSIR